MRQWRKEEGTVALFKEIRGCRFRAVNNVSIVRWIVMKGPRLQGLHDNESFWTADADAVHRRDHSNGHWKLGKSPKLLETPGIKLNDSY